MACEKSGTLSSPTEQSNPRTADIDRLGTADVLLRLLDEDAGVPDAVRRALPAINRATELLLATLQRGGRWLYVGAGTSGRIGLLDAAELPPTYGLDPSKVQGILAGGDDALVRAVEGAEDDRAAAVPALDARGFSSRDTLFALSASGRTPFTLAAVEHARALSAPTIGLTCVPDAPLARAVDCPIVVVVGPEAIAGSTRLKGGLAEKMVLHMISTAVMVRSGRVQGNLMTALRPHSAKLRERAVRIVMELSGAGDEAAGAALDEAEGSVEAALRSLSSV